MSLRWGTRGDEATRSLPGDDILPIADLQATRAISIDAPRAEVWPWIAQIGQNRAGFYSYDWMENLVGIDIHSADRLMPELRIRGVGEAVNLAPPVALDVAAFEEGDHLVLRGGVGPDGRAQGAPYDFTWAFALVDETGGGTRLVVRERYAYLTPWAAAMVEPVEFISFLMSERMLRGIRDRAERAPRH
ncbi:SRPBCC family protein [Agromyces sp. ZXT2-6]|uniref:SRPBCC family protein n=1 Tax=Agromyces sp. ZXT2-6 TaxID=3461153 RepID=UPI004054C447